MKEYTVSKVDASQKIEKYIKKCLNNTPLSMIYKLFRKKDIKVNGIRVNKDYIVKENDLVQIYLPNTATDLSKEKKVSKIPILFDVLYEDENLLIVNKPAGVLVHEDSSVHYNTLFNQVLYYLSNKNEYDPNVSTFTPGPCHRLDRNTSGIVVFGKNVESLKIMNDAFKERTGISKFYYALVFGRVEKEQEIRCNLLKDENNGIVKVVKNGGLESCSIVRPVKISEKYSLVEVELLTGRTHQIRVHMAYINHPVVGDKKYGNFQENSVFNKEFSYENQFLHAYKFKFEDLPGKLSYLNGKEIICPISDEKKKILNKIFK